MHWDTDVFGFGTFLEIWSYSACLELGGHGRHGQGTTIEQYQSWIRRLPDHVGEYQFFMMLDFRGCGVLMKSSTLQLSILSMMHSYCLYSSSALSQMWRLSG